MIDIVIPLYNEEKILTKSVETTIDFLKRKAFHHPYRLILANNASTDSSWNICIGLARRYPSLVKAFEVGTKGKGIAIRKAWQESDADIVAFMDADLSSDLSFLAPLIDIVHDGRADLAIGNRLGDNSKIISRRIIRGYASQFYNFCTRSLLKTNFDDHQCGFKAMNKKAFLSVAPHLKENGFFFDTELIALSLKKGYKIKDIDIVWREAEGSKVSLFRDSIKMFGDLLRLRQRIKRL